MINNHNRLVMIIQIDMTDKYFDKQNKGHVK